MARMVTRYPPRGSDVIPSHRGDAFHLDQEVRVEEALDDAGLTMASASPSPAGSVAEDRLTAIPPILPGAYHQARAFSERHARLTAGV